MASWKDDKSTTCTVVITLTPTGGTAKTVNSGEKLSEDGTLQLKVSDEAGNSSEAEITLTKTDSQAPEISIKIQEKNVIAGIKVVVDGNQLYFDDQVAATWKDDFTENCKVEISLVPEEGEPRTINSGETIKDSGTLIIQVQDDYDNKATGEIKLTKTDSQAPTITLLIQEKNVIAGVKVLVKDNQLIFDQDIFATWTDDYSETFTVELYLFVDGCEPESINPGDLITKAGVLKIHVSDEFQNKTIAEITLTAVAITGLENLQNLTFQVDQEVNLLQGLTIADGLTLSKVEVEQDGVRSEIPNPQAYIPEFPGIVNIILTLARLDGSTIEVKVDNLTVNALAYNKMTVTDIKPVDILPIIGQIEAGDKNCYSYIEHLRVAEATRLRDMMWEYGTVQHSPEEYRKLMMRLNAGMTWETPT